MNELNILHLYPNELNTYGDHGNRIVLMRRMQRRNLKPTIHYHHPGAVLPKRIDIVIGGGGQDSAQSDVQTDVLRIGEQLHKLAERNVPMVLVCGSYQLFGHRFITQIGKEVKGIGIFDAETVGSENRMIGNLMVKTDFGIMYGFENHSGQTFLGKNQAALGNVLRGNGNNGRDKTEGARTKNVFGTYMHGPILPNNPHFCDELISMALSNLGLELNETVIDDSLSELTREGARSRKY